MFRKKDKWGSVRRAHRIAENINKAGTVRELDLLTGYAVGVLDEKYWNNELSAKMAEKIADKINTISRAKRDELLLNERYTKVFEECEEEEEDQKIVEFGDYYDPEE